MASARCLTVTRTDLAVPIVLQGAANRLVHAARFEVNYEPCVNPPRVALVQPIVEALQFFRRQSVYRAFDVTDRVHIHGPTAILPEWPSAGRRGSIAETVHGADEFSVSQRTLYEAFAASVSKTYRKHRNSSRAPTDPGSLPTRKEFLSGKRLWCGPTSPRGAPSSRVRNPHPPKYAAVGLNSRHRTVRDLAGDKNTTRRRTPRARHGPRAPSARATRLRGFP